jgi:L-seryl-tRNA(Ser) seleniumtransferase
MSTRDWASELGIRPVINASGPNTRSGGHRMHPEVIEAMAWAASVHLPIDELQVQAGILIADITGAEAGYVTAGAAAGLTLAAAACITGSDILAMSRLPDASGRPHEIVVQRGHRNGYDRAFRAAGARLVDVGDLGYPGGGMTQSWQIRAAIGPQTVAVACPVQAAPGLVPLEDVVRVAHEAGVPVIVDAAAALPPAEHLRSFISAGADLVVFSGGKAIGGPQASGIVCGRADLIRSIALQHQDQITDQRTWSDRRLIEEGRIAGMPENGIGRSMKVGRESIVGLMVALGRFVAADHVAEAARQRLLLDGIAQRLGSSGPHQVTILPEGPARPYPSLLIDLGGAAAGDAAADVVVAAAASDPPVLLGQQRLAEGIITVLASTLVDDEADLVVDRLTDLLRRRGHALDGEVAGMTTGRLV